MKSGFALTVHVVPVGQEVDRALRPFDAIVPNRVHIVAGFASAAADRVVRELKKRHVQAGVSVADLSDMESMLCVIASLIRTEQDAGNTVYVNMSAGGELAAVAAALAGMALGAEVYCVSPGTSSEVSILPKVDIHLPDAAEIPVLSSLYYADGQELSASEIGELVDEPEGCCLSDSEESYGIMDSRNMEIERYEQRKVQSRNLMKVSGMMKRMEEKGYVTKSKLGRRMMYRLSERGRYAMMLSGHIR